MLGNITGNKFSRFLVFTLAVVLSIATFAHADGMVEEDMPKKPAKPVVREQAPVPPPPPVEHVAAPKPVPQETWIDDCEWKFRLSPGLTVAFFDEESNLPMPNLSMDIWRTDYPINFRVGIEGRHMYLGQEEAEFAQEYFDKTTRVTYIRIPFALEYMHPLGDSVTWFAGLGPDIIHTANDISETNVGLHLSTRLHYAFNDSWGMAVEAGYMWGHVDGEGEDVSLDNAFITPSISYTF